MCFTPEFLTEAIGWVGNVLLALGSIGIAYKRRAAFVAFALGNICYTGVGYMTGLTSLVGVSLFMLALDVFGFIKWSTDETTRQLD